ncbi:hypothetical protein ANN_17212 [Periplaneta americana]|uniref:Protein YIPF3 n=1 Tax=Periplaneta americana TaxID=6978 RepID=A0ABQ8STQ8_PERAM|nr:hypothetical protein ANN_17212 [Periplaneta americana]
MVGKSCSVIFIGNDNPSTKKFQENDWKDNKSGTTVWPVLTSIKNHFLVPLDELPHRIFVSLVPPILGEKFRHVYVDFLGPSLALLLMAAILHYGHASKLPSAAANTTPTEVLLLYAVLMPAAAYILGWLCRATVTLSEMYALLGYGMYGHVLTLALSLFFFHEESNAFFFLSMIVFGGMSALRVALILLASIPAPAARLLVCSFVATVQLLSLVFLHFAYMHRTFVYAAAELTDASV